MMESYPAILINDCHLGALAMHVDPDVDRTSSASFPSPNVTRSIALPG